MSQTTIELAQTKTTDHSAVDAALSRLREGASSLTGCTLEERIRLASECIQGVAEVATAWVESACQAKAIPPGSAARSEEITAGPVSVLRYLRLFIRTLEDIQRSGSPRLPGRPRQENGQSIVPVFPTKSLYDAVIFYQMKAETWLEASVRPDQLFGEHIAGAPCPNSSCCRRP